jgi:hypothetical protein
MLDLSAFHEGSVIGRSDRISSRIDQRRIDEADGC